MGNPWGGETLEKVFHMWLSLKNLFVDDVITRGPQGAPSSRVGHAVYAAGAALAAGLLGLLRNLLG